MEVARMCRQPGSHSVHRALGVLLPCLALSACVTTGRRPLPGYGLAGGKPELVTNVRVFDPTGLEEASAVVGRGPTAVGRLRPSPWGAQDPKKLNGPAAQTRPAGPGDEARPAQKPVAGEQEPLKDEDLYARFGSRIIIQADGQVTKTYYVDADTGKVLTELLKLAAIGDKPPAAAAGQVYKVGAKGKKEPSVLDSLLGDYEITVLRVTGFDTMKPISLVGKAFNGALPATGAAVANDLVLVTAVPDGLEAFEQAMDLFYRSVPQIIIEAKVIEIAWGDTLDVGVGQTAAATPTLKTRGKGGFVKQLVSKFPNSSLATIGTAVASTSEGLLTLGGIHDNLELNAQLELLQQRTKSDIVSHPKIAVRNGGVALIDTTTQIPYPRAQIIGNNTKTDIQFAKVGVSMQIRPTVVPGETVVLQLMVAVDAITGFAETDPIPTPEISTRKAVTSVHVPSGKTTVIGGLITKTLFENESQVPLLGDIPILGWLFRSTFVQRGESEVVFMITPRIVYGFEGAELDEEFLGGGY